MPDCPNTITRDDGRRCTLQPGPDDVELNIITAYVVTRCHYTCVDDAGRQSLHMIRRKRLFWIFSWTADD